MKRFLLVLLSLCLLMAAGCGTKSPAVYETDGFVIDMDKGTITHGEDVYRFELTQDSNYTDVEITYPNGATYYWTKTDNMSHGGWSDDYDPERYVPGDELRDLLALEAPRQQRGGNLLAALLLLALGLLYTASPRTGWYLSYGWRFRNAEPSDAALVLGRVSGVIAMLAGVILFFV